MFLEPFATQLAIRRVLLLIGSVRSGCSNGRVAYHTRGGRPDRVERTQVTGFNTDVVSTSLRPQNATSRFKTGAL
jgi:hypothetical protein